MLLTDLISLQRQCTVRLHPSIGKPTLLSLHLNLNAGGWIVSYSCRVASLSMSVLSITSKHRSLLPM